MFCSVPKYEKLSPMATVVISRQFHVLHSASTERVMLGGRRDVWSMSSQCVDMSSRCIELCRQAYARDLLQRQAAHPERRSWKVDDLTFEVLP